MWVWTRRGRRHDDMPSTPGAGDTPAPNATLTSRVIRVRFCRENPIPKYFISAAAGTRKGDDESHVVHGERSPGRRAAYRPCSLGHLLLWLYRRYTHSQDTTHTCGRTALAPTAPVPSTGQVAMANVREASREAAMAASSSWSTLRTRGCGSDFRVGGASARETAMTADPAICQLVV